MMKEKDIATGTAPCGWYAAVDAQRRNTNNMSIYTEAQRGLALRAKDLIDLAYQCQAVHINYRKTFIAIKLESPMVKNRQALKTMEKIFEDRGYTKVRSDQGVVYRIPKTVQP